MANNTLKRKIDHIDRCLKKDVAFTKKTGLEQYEFVHDALPDIDKREIDTTTWFLGKELSAPLMISAISGGPSLAGKLNKNLAIAAQKLKIPLALGSMRIALEDPSRIKTFKVRDLAPDIPLLANLGAVQLNYGYGIEQCQCLVDMFDADALVLHLNPLQEAIQPGGNTDFSGLAGKIRSIVKQLTVPVIIKEVGCGISYDTARKLYSSGIRIIDVAGAGGTSFAAVESYSNPVGNAFRNWGIPTAESIISARAACGSNSIIIASGGIRTGIDIAKSLALGADLAATALPFLAPGIKGTDHVIDVINCFIQELKTTMFCTGAIDLKELKKKRMIKLD